MSTREQLDSFLKAVSRFVGLCLLFTLPGCNRAASEAQAPPERSANSAGSESQESWDVFYMNGTKIGYTHTTIQPVVEGGRNLVKYVSDSRFLMKRFGQTITQRIVLTSIESPTGELVRFESDMTAGSATIRTTGSVENGRLQIETTTKGKRQRSTMGWDDAYVGFLEADRGLERKPMKPGERRTLKALVPVFLQIADVRLEASDYQTVQLPNGKQRLLKIKSTVDLGDGQKIESLIWTDRTGQALKTLVPGLGQESYRTTREVALDESEMGTFDLGKHSTVKVQRRLRDPHKTRRVVYRVHTKNADPLNVFVAGASQRIEAIDEHTAEITVRAIRPGDPATLHAKAREPTPEDLSANSLIQSDDKRIVEMARAASKGTVPWQIATQLESAVHESMRSRNFSQAFATAAEVAQTLEGDCTEHAVLLAALCRARKIPARVAIGLVYFPEAGGFAYHMWNEVWIRDRWVPLDATLGRGGIGAAHLKLGDSHLKGAGALSALLPVLQVLGQLDVEIVEVEY